MDKVEELARDICETCNSYKACTEHSVPCDMAYIVADKLYNKKGYTSATQDTASNYIEDTWIKPADRLPPKNQRVICMVGLCSSTKIRDGYYADGYWDVQDAYGRVIAWRPIDEEK